MAFVRDSVDTVATRPDATTRAGGPGSDQHGQRRWAGIAFAALAWLLVASVIVQIFIAGVAVFADGTRWETHASFVHVFEFVPVVMLIVALVGRLGRRSAILSGLLFVLIGAQYALAELRTSDIPELAALHVVNAVVIYAIAMNLARGAITRLRRSPAV